MSYTESVTVKMESGLKKRASNQAAEEKLSMSELGRKAMKAYLREKARMDIRRYGISKENVIEMIKDDGWDEWKLDHGILMSDVTAAFRVTNLGDLGSGYNSMIVADDGDIEAALGGVDTVVIDRIRGDDYAIMSSHVIGFNKELGILIVGRGD